MEKHRFIFNNEIVTSDTLPLIRAYTLFYKDTSKIKMGLCPQRSCCSEMRDASLPLLVSNALRVTFSSHHQHRSDRFWARSSVMITVLWQSTVTSESHSSRLKNRGVVTHCPTTVVIIRRAQFQWRFANVLNVDVPIKGMLGKESRFHSVYI